MPSPRHILFVDDEAAVRDGLRRALRGRSDPEWHLHFAGGVDEALERVAQTPIDAVVSDVSMPGRDGFDLVEALQESPVTAGIPIVILTGLNEIDLKRRALDLGAVDLLSKPVVCEDLIACLRRVLRLKGYEDQLRDQNERLERQVAERTEQLDRSRLEILWRLARAGEFRDGQTGLHVGRVSGYCRTLAARLGLSGPFIETITLTSPLHDIGKIGVSDTILLKPGPLDRGERSLMERHCEIGYEILKRDPAGLHTFRHWRGEGGTARSRAEDNPLLDEAAAIALTHHEKWDGSGYPRGLHGEAIPLASRLVAVADVYDALSHARPYKPAFPEEKVEAIMRRTAPGHFDPEVFAGYEGVLDQWREIKHHFADPPAAAA